MSDWQWLNLSASEYDADPQPPAWCDLIYAGGRHMLSGPSESMKTIVAWILALESMRAVEWEYPRVAHADFEMGPTRTRRLLEDLGADKGTLESIYYVEPLTPPGEHQLGEDIADEGAHLAIIDAAAGAYGVQELDDNARKDAEKFARTWIDPLWRRGVATILVDHVVKRSDERGKYAIGSERKVGQVDVHLGVEVVQQLVRGGRGVLKIRTHKDRGHGVADAPRAARRRPR